MHVLPSVARLLLMLSLLVPVAGAAPLSGKVVAVQGQQATIQLQSGSGALPIRGDRVELSYAVGADVIPAGTWRVRGVNADGSVLAEPLEPLVFPQLNMDAVVHASGAQPSGGETQGRERTDPAQDEGTPDWRRQQMAREALGAGLPQQGPIDLDLAGQMYQQLSSGVNLEENSRLAWAYLKGRDGMPKNDHKAFELFKKGCESGMARNCVTLGWLYQKGRGVGRDDAKAAAAYGQGCAWKDAEGCMLWGEMFENGHGVERDAARARSLYEKSCHNGWEKACERIGR